MIKFVTGVILCLKTIQTNKNMEQYKIRHNDKIKPRNRAEHTLIEATKIAFKDPTDLTIEEVYDIVKRNCDIIPKSWG